MLKIDCALSVSQSDGVKEQIRRLVHQETFEGLGPIARYAQDKCHQWLYETVKNRVGYQSHLDITMLMINPKRIWAWNRKDGTTDAIPSLESFILPHMSVKPWFASLNKVWKGLYPASLPDWVDLLTLALGKRW